MAPLSCPVHWAVVLLLTLSACDAAEMPPSKPSTTPAVEPALPPGRAATDDRCRLATAESGRDDCPSLPDADHDGVGDGNDRCPDTTPGIAVDPSGCATASRE